jgi:hypothetical protein
VQHGGTGSGAILSIVSGMARSKQFFFEKKHQKTFIRLSLLAHDIAQSRDIVPVWRLRPRLTGTS